jgi:glycolate oxidase iron-sulfur subunit
MKNVLEGELAWSDALPYVDRCLGCLACVTACPSGVQYGELLTPFRAQAEAHRTRGLIDRLRRTLTLATLPYPARFRMAARLGQLARHARGLVPAPFRAMLDLLPADLPAARPLPELTPAIGPRKARVALLAGCAQQVLAPNIGWAALRVLAHAGVEVPNIADIDAIVTTAAGCGSGLRDYAQLFEGEPAPDADRAKAFAARVIDIAAFLQRLDLPELPPLPAPVKVAYHDACHLAHAQGVRAEPRALLRRIPNVTLVEVPNAGDCCGSAGTYNLDQPDIARELGLRKANALLSTQADIIVSGNIGCLTQIRSAVEACTPATPMPEVMHTIELIVRAVQSRS